jgi:biopolymer transport protein ExbD
MKRRSQSLQSMAQIDMTPLIDLAFSLLIIFMISTPLLEQTIALNLPKESHRPQKTQQDNRLQAIALDEKGDLFWGKERVSFLELNQRLLSLAAESKPPAIHLRADQTLPYGQVMAVVDAIKAAQLNQLCLDTQVK